MEVYIVWAGGKTLIGKIDGIPESGERIFLLEALEVKGLLINTPGGIREVVQFVSIVPLSGCSKDINIKLDMVLPIGKTDDIYKMYVQFKSGLTIADEVDTNLLKRMK